MESMKVPVLFDEWTPEPALQADDRRSGKFKQLKGVESDETLDTLLRPAVCRRHRGACPIDATGVNELCRYSKAGYAFGNQTQGLARTGALSGCEHQGYHAVQR